MPSTAVPALLFAAGCAVAGSVFFYFQWARDTARIGPAPPGTLGGMLLWFVGWSMVYAFVGWFSVVALGVLVVALFMWMQLGGARDRTTWDLSQQIRDSWWVATIVSAPSIWVAYLLRAGNW
jgi:hypothetical protein